VAADEYVVDFPSLGFLAADWVEAHCIVPDGFGKGSPFVEIDWQLWCTVNHYRVAETAVWRPENPMKAAAFHYRRSQIIAPQKTGKGPWSAAKAALEASGPALFGGWAKAGDAYDCADNGCTCGWGYDYEPGEPMGIRWPTPLIQLLAASDDQTENIYRPLRAMIAGGPLRDQLLIREGFIRILRPGDPDNDAKIDRVTSAARSRLGNPITSALQDETGTYTMVSGLRSVASTQRRGLAGMGGRAIGTTNAYDPAQETDAQLTHESRRPDIFKFYREPPKTLSYKNKSDRRKIHEYVYQGSPWVDLDVIEAEAAELMETDPAQAERFYGNRFVQGAGSWLPDGLWEQWEVKS
jgi:hypothetical protein